MSELADNAMGLILTALPCGTVPQDRFLQSAKQRIGEKTRCR
jgi:hypothetical protein